jgi:cell division protein FtsW
MSVTADVPTSVPGRRLVDGGLLAATAVLVAVGLLGTYTASYRLGDAFWGEGMFFLKRQLVWVLIGLAVAVVTAGVDYRVWRRYSVPLMAGTLAVLLVMLVVHATRFGGGRWLTAGGSIQPSEVAKLAVIVYVADWLSSKREDIRVVELGLIPFVMLTGLVCGLIVLQNHLSTGVLIGLVAMAMFFTAGAEIKQLGWLALLGAFSLAGLIAVMPYRLARVSSFLHPEADPAGAGYQVSQTIGAIVRGGLFGVGLGNGQQKHFIPAPHTDAVFAVLGEELGLIGALLVVGLFALFAWRGFQVAAGADDRFASLLALGITCWIAFQALMNVAVVTSMMPFTGVPLPFVSYGGSSLVVTLAATGLLLNLSRQTDPGRTRTHAHLDFRRGNRRSRLSRDHRARNRAR